MNQEEAPWPLLASDPLSAFVVLRSAFIVFPHFVDPNLPLG
jgi:hypothetical protein